MMFTALIDRQASLLKGSRPRIFENHMGGDGGGSSGSGAYQLWVGGVLQDARLSWSSGECLANQPKYAAKWVKFERETKRPRSSPLAGIRL